MKNTIALINVQIGSYKNYNSLFLNSCKKIRMWTSISYGSGYSVTSNNIHIVKVSFSESQRKDSRTV